MSRYSLLATRLTRSHSQTPLQVAAKRRAEPGRPKRSQSSWGDAKLRTQMPCRPRCSNQACAREWRASRKSAVPPMISKPARSRMASSRAASFASRAIVRARQAVSASAGKRARPISIAAPETAQGPRPDGCGGKLGRGDRKAEPQAREPIKFPKGPQHHRCPWAEAAARGCARRVSTSMKASSTMSVASLARQAARRKLGKGFWRDRRPSGLFGLTTTATS